MPQVQVIQPIQQQPKRLRVAAYARVSSDSEDQLNSLSVQVDYYTHLIQENPNWDLAGIYADEGITGTSTKHREQFNRLLDDCRAGLIDRVLVKSASRFARNTADALASVREMKSLGVTVVFEKEGFDTETSNGEMILSMICAVAQEESLSISKNLKWGIRKRMQNGTYTNSSVPFGYSLENHLLVINNQQAMIVADIFKRYLAGESISKIAQYLNNTYPKETGVWQYSSVQLILQNETYKGDTRYQKHYTANLFPTKVSHNRGQVSQYYIAKSHEAIISDEDFDKVQSLLKMKAPHKPKVAEKLFDQKLYCAVCGTLFARKTRTSGAVVWGCRKHLNKSGLCSVKSVYETELCRVFLCMHNKLLINQEKIFEPLLNSLSHLKSYQEKLDTMRMGIQVEIQRLAKQKHNLERIYAQGLIEDSQYLERKALIEQQLFEKKEFLTRKPLAGNIDRLLKNTRLIKRLIGTCQPLMYFDKQVFTSLVSKVTISDTSFEFELINGMRVSERRTSK